MRTRIVTILAVVALTSMVIPVMAAEPARDPLVIGVVGTDITGGPSDAAKVDRMAASDLAPGRLKKVDALLLDGDGFAEASDAPGALRAYLNTGRPIFVKNGALAALNDLIDGPLVAASGDAVEGIHLTDPLLGSAVDVDRDTTFERVTGIQLVTDGERKVPRYVELFAADGSDVDNVAHWASLPGLFDAPTLTMASTQSDTTYWSGQGVITVCVTSNTYGDVCADHEVYYLYDDGTAVYDYWTNIHSITTYPGIGYYGTQWRAYRHLAYSDVDYYRSDNLLIDYSPPSQSHTGTVRTEVGTTAGEYGAVVTKKLVVGYGLDHGVLTQASSMSSNYFYAYHTIDQGTVDSDTSYSTKPGQAVRTTGDTTYKNSFVYRGYWRHAGTGDVTYTGGYETYAFEPPTAG